MRPHWLALVLPLIFLVTSCAKKGFPPGGPPDLTSPEIVSTTPENGATRIPTVSTITVQFTERMNRKSVENSVFISPPLETDLKWKGNSLVLHPLKELTAIRTYSVTLGSDCQDLQGNRLRNSYSFAFSSGGTVDSGAITGVIYNKDKPEQGIAVWAYVSNDEEVILPWQRKADYATQTGQDGKFELRYLGPGRYQLFALMDINRNQLWDPGSEPLGLTYKEITFDNQSVRIDNLPFLLVNRDTSAFSILSCQLLDKSKLKLTFSKDLAALRPSGVTAFSILTDALKVLEPISVYQVSGQAKALYLQVPELDPQKIYRVKADKITSQDGSIIDSISSSCQFTGTDKSDETAPEVVHHSPGKNESGVRLNPEVTLHFSELMEQNLIETGFDLVDSSGQQIKGNLSWNDALTLSFVPLEKLQAEMHYTARLSGSAVKDLARNSLKDSLYVFGFQTLNPDSTGSVTGSVRFGKDKFLGKVIVSLKALDRQKIYREMVSPENSFLFNEVLPGRYALEGLVDFDNNGIYSFGTVRPFSLAEPYAVGPDTIVVRPRWTTENIILNF